MSIHVLSWVLRHSPVTHGQRLVLIALAEFAHDDGSKAFPTIDTLMERSRLGRSAVKNALRALRDLGAIVHTGNTRYGTPIYTVVMGGQNLTRPESDPGQMQRREGPISDPNPSEEPSERKESASARVLKITGKPVKNDTWAKTVFALETFNVATGKSLSPLTGAGQPSESAKRIYLRLIDYPALSWDDIEGVIDRTLRSKWWGEDAASIGVVFGPKVFDENLTRTPTEKPKDDRAERTARRLEAVARRNAAKAAEQ